MVSYSHQQAPLGYALKTLVKIPMPVGKGHLENSLLALGNSVHSMPLSSPLGKAWKRVGAVGTGA